MADFVVDLNRVIEKAQVSLDTAVREVTQDLAREILVRTPVITGNLRASWFVKVDGTRSPRGELVPSSGNRFPSPSSRQVAAISAVLSQAKAGDVIYYVNNANYAAAVEYGTASREGRAMVRNSIAILPQIAKSTIQRIRRFKGFL